MSGALQQRHPVRGTEKQVFARRYGRTLAGLRTAAKLSQAELAQRVGVHRNTIHRIELGHRIPDLLQHRLLQEALGVTPQAGAEGSAR